MTQDKYIVWPQILYSFPLLHMLICHRYVWDIKQFVQKGVHVSQTETNKKSGNTIYKEGISYSYRDSTPTGFAPYIISSNMYVCVYICY